MIDHTWFDNELSEVEDNLDFLTESMAFDYVNEIRRVMTAQNMSQAELANRIGKSRAYVSKVLNYNPNLTIRSLANIALALGIRLRWTRPRLVDKDSIDYLDSIVLTNSSRVFPEQMTPEIPPAKAIPTHKPTGKRPAEQ